VTWVVVVCVGALELQSPQILWHGSRLAKTRTTMMLSVQTTTGGPDWVVVEQWCRKTMAR